MRPVITRISRSTHVPNHIGLSWLDSKAAVSFVSGDPKALLDEIRDRAQSLIGPDATSARRRNIARALAMTNSQLSVLQMLQGQALAAQNWKAVEQLDRMLDRLTRRYGDLILVHRQEYSSQPTVQVTTQHASIYATNGDGK